MLPPVITTTNIECVVHTLNNGSFDGGPADASGSCIEVSYEYPGDGVSPVTVTVTYQT